MHARSTRVSAASEHTTILHAAQGGGGPAGCVMNIWMKSCTTTKAANGTHCGVSMQCQEPATLSGYAGKALRRRQRPGLGHAAGQLCLERHIHGTFVRVKPMCVYSLRACTAHTASDRRCATGGPTACHAARQHPSSQAAGCCVRPAGEQRAPQPRAGHAAGGRSSESCVESSMLWGIMLGQ